MANGTKEEPHFKDHPIVTDRHGDKRVVFTWLGNQFHLRFYHPPADNDLEARINLVCSFHRRLFHNSEPGIDKKDEIEEDSEAIIEAARAKYETSKAGDDREVERRAAAELAGLLFNYSSLILTNLLEREAEIESEPEKKDDPERTPLYTEGGSINYHGHPILLKCMRYFTEAAALGPNIKKRVGPENSQESAKDIDSVIAEMWGEPLKAFTFPLENFYLTRYQKLAEAFQYINIVSEKMAKVVAANNLEDKLGDELKKFTKAVKARCDTMRSDPKFPGIEEEFKKSKKSIKGAVHELIPDSLPKEHPYHDVTALLLEGRKLILDMCSIHGARKNSVGLFVEKCEQHIQGNEGPSATSIGR